MASLDTQFEGYKTLIVGLGVSGLSIARFLYQHHFDFEVIDDKENPQGYQALMNDMPNIKFHIGLSKQEPFDNADNIIVSPGVPNNIPTLRHAAKKGKHIFSDIQLFSHYVKKNQKVIAITGTNGKTTVTSLVTEMIKNSGINVAAGGNLGKASLDLLDDQVEVYVLELSSFQLEITLTIHPTVSVILNISEDHLDRYPSFEAYRDAKLKVHQDSQHVIINRMEDSLESMKCTDSAMNTSFGLDKPDEGHFGLIQTDEGQAIAWGDEPWIGCDELELSGTSGILNTQAAFAIGKALDLPHEVMINVAQHFKGLPHRLQKVGCHQGVDWINDSKATNVGATSSALQSSDKSAILICGGESKDADFTPLKEAVEKYTTAVILIGRDADKIKEALKEYKPIYRANNMQMAVEKAHQIAIDGQRVLLSPACASFDMYKNYMQRGDDFVTQFKRISQ